MERKYHKKRLSFGRKMVKASATVSHRKNIIHSLLDIDISKSRRIMKRHFEMTGEKLSLTAYFVTCLAGALKEFPEFNSFIRRNKLIVMEDITISVLVEREIENEKVPEPVGIRNAGSLSFRQVQDEIREASLSGEGDFGELSGMGWIRLIPSFLLRSFVSIAERNIKLALRYGKISVTSVGMFCHEPAWFIPHGSGTVLLTVGSIEKKVVEVNGKYQTREHIRITASFDHDIIDGAPAARFVTRLGEMIKSGELLKFGYSGNENS